MLPLLFFVLSTATALFTYAPLPAICPKGSLVRPASGLSNNEETYRVARKAIADEALALWLKKINPDFGTDDLPTVCPYHGKYKKSTDFWRLLLPPVVVATDHFLLVQALFKDLMLVIAMSAQVGSSRLLPIKQGYQAVVGFFLLLLEIIILQSAL